MKWVVLMIFAITLLADVYIYRSVICAYFKRLSGRMAYIVFALLTNLAALSVFFLYGGAAVRGSGAVITVMWMTWVFFLTALPRLLWVAGSFFDWLISVIFRRRLPVFRVLALFLSVGGIIVMIYGSTGGRHRFQVNEITLTSCRVPESFDGYRIVQFSDLHLGTMCKPGKLVDNMVAIINSLDADLVVNTGDILNIDYRDLTSEIAGRLSRIKSRDGVVSVYGNHDLGFYIRDSVSLTPDDNLTRLKGTLDGMGWRTLRDESYYLRKGGDSIIIAGLNFPPDSRLSGHNAHLSGVDIPTTFEHVDSRSYSVVLSHAPQVWDEILAAGFGDLTLSGHVHSMQVKLRLFGKPWSPAKWIYPEWSGLYEKEGKFLYINDGIGCVGYPMRIGAWPELTLITLKRCE